MIFSIILTTYNRAHLLKRAIDSVLQQTFSDFELLIINDCSTDYSVQLLEIYQKNPRIHCFHNATNSGVSFSRNVGISHAKGTYLAFLDDDDEYFPHFLETVYRAFQNNLSLDFLWTSYQKIITPHNKVFPHIWRSFNNLTFLTQLSFSFGVVINKKCFNSIGYFDKNLKTNEDLDIFFRLVQHQFKGDSLSEVLIKIHQHSLPSLSRSPNWESRLKDTRYFIQKHQLFLSQYPTLEKHYYDMLIGLNYRAHFYSEARHLILYLFKKHSINFSIVEKIIRFEILKPLFNK